MRKVISSLVMGSLGFVALQLGTASKPAKADDNFNWECSAFDEDGSYEDEDQSQAEFGALLSVMIACANISNDTDKVQCCQYGTRMEMQFGEMWYVTQYAKPWIKHYN